MCAQYKFSTPFSILNVHRNRTRKDINTFNVITKTTIYFDGQHKFQEVLICWGRLLLSDEYFHTSLKVIPWEGEEMETNDWKSKMAKLSSAWTFSLFSQPIQFAQTGNWTVVLLFNVFIWQTDRRTGTVWIRASPEEFHWLMKQDGLFMAPQSGSLTFLDHLPNHNMLAYWPFENNFPVSRRSRDKTSSAHNLCAHTEVIQ